MTHRSQFTIVNKNNDEQRKNQYIIATKKGQQLDAQWFIRFILFQYLDSIRVSMNVCTLFFSKHTSASIFSNLLLIWRKIQWTRFVCFVYCRITLDTADILIFFFLTIFSYINCTQCSEFILFYLLKIRRIDGTLFTRDFQEIKW